MSYTLGAWLQIGTSTTSELRQIQSLANNGATSTVITVGALIGNAAAAAGTAVQQIQQHKIGTSPTVTARTTWSIEDNHGNQFVYKYAGVYIDKWNVKVAAQDFLVTADLYGTVDPVYSATYTTPAPSAGESSDLTRPLSINESQFVGYSDPLQSGGTTGAAAQQSLTWIETAEIDFMPGLLKKPLHNLTRTYKAFGNSLGGTVKWTFLNVSQRPDLFTDYVQSATNNVIPFSMGAALNSAASGAATWNAVGYYIPNVFLEMAEPVKSVGDMLLMNVQGEIAPQSATADAYQCFITNPTDLTVY